jgi:hypothetical protein
LVWKICIQQLILKNHKISKEGKDPKERGKSPTRARAHKERGHKEKTQKRKQECS